MIGDVHTSGVESYRGLRFRWSCSCGRKGPKWYQIHGLAALAGEAHEQAMNVKIDGEAKRR